MANQRNDTDYRTGYIRSHLRSPSGRVRWKWSLWLPMRITDGVFKNSVFILCLHDESRVHLSSNLFTVVKPSSSLHRILEYNSNRSSLRSAEIGKIENRIRIIFHLMYEYIKRFRNKSKTRTLIEEWRKLNLKGVKFPFQWGLFSRNLNDLNENPLPTPTQLPFSLHATLALNGPNSHSFLALHSWKKAFINRH